VPTLLPSCWHLALHNLQQLKELLTVVSSHSRPVEIVARERLGIKPQIGPSMFRIRQKRPTSSLAAVKVDAAIGTTFGTRSSFPSTLVNVWPAPPVLRDEAEFHIDSFTNVASGRDADG